MILMASVNFETEKTESQEVLRIVSKGGLEELVCTTVVLSNLIGNPHTEKGFGKLQKWSDTVPPISRKVSKTVRPSNKQLR